VCVCVCVCIKRDEDGPHPAEDLLDQDPDALSGPPPTHWRGFFAVASGRLHAPLDEQGRGREHDSERECD
jgi:hypothetical protein